MPESNSTTPIEYRDCPGHFGRRVSNDGSVWTCLKRKGRGINGGPGSHMVASQDWKRMKLHVGKNGYLTVALKNKTTTVHRLILEAFVGPCPDGMECRHLDGNRTNNRLDNLKWGTRGENMQDALQHDTIPVGERRANSVLTADFVQTIRRLRKNGMSSNQIAKTLGKNRTTVLNVIRGTTWKHVS